METYRYRVTLEVEIDAFNESDAVDALEDEFGVEENANGRVVSCEYRPLGKKK